MLSGFTVRGYKAFADTHAPLAPLTLVYGQNSAGKSTLIDALHLAMAGSRDAAGSGHPTVTAPWRSFLENRATFHHKNRTAPFYFELHASDESLSITIEPGAKGGVRALLPRDLRALESMAAQILDDGAHGAGTQPTHEVLMGWGAVLKSLEVESDDGEAPEAPQHLITELLAADEHAAVLDSVPRLLSVGWSMSEGSFESPATIGFSNSSQPWLPAGMPDAYLASTATKFDFDMLGLYFGRLLANRRPEIHSYWDEFAEVWGADWPGAAVVRDQYGLPNENELECGSGWLTRIAFTTVTDALAGLSKEERGTVPTCAFTVSRLLGPSPHIFAKPIDETADWEAGWDRRDSALRSCLADDLTQRLLVAFRHACVPAVQIGPVRRRPGWAEDVPAELIQRLRKTKESDVAYDGHLFPAVVFANQRTNALDRINGWLSRMGVPYEYRQARPRSIRSEGARGKVEMSGYSFRPRLLDRQRITETGNPIEVSFEDVGFGLNQLLPIVAQLCVPMPENSLVSIQQPELHVHPRLQTEMADLFLEASMTEMTDAAFPPKQVVVETHSEHILLRIQRRIREGKIRPEHVSVLYVHTNVDGESVVSRIRLGDNGEFLDEWPEGFFGERLMEILSL
jgi:hypothetical protein